MTALCLSAAFDVYNLFKEFFTKDNLIIYFGPRRDIDECKVIFDDKNLTEEFIEEYLRSNTSILVYEYKICSNIQIDFVFGGHDIDNNYVDFVSHDKFIPTEKAIEEIKEKRILDKIIYNLDLFQNKRIYY